MVGKEVDVEVRDRGRVGGGVREVEEGGEREG